MRIGAVGRLAGLLLWACGSAAAAPSIIVNPDWLEKPSGEDMARHYPDLAAQLRLGGRATISCEVAASGAVVNCNVVQEAPEGLGFGQAAQSMAPIFRMSPRLKDGTPVGGGTVRIPIRFAIPATPPTTPGAALPNAGAISPAARAAAASLLKGSGFASAKSLTPSTPLSDTKVQTDGEEALREAKEAVQPEIVDAIAQVLGARFDEPELEDLAAFLASPAGASLMRAWASSNQATRKASNTYFRRVLLDARSKACAQISCPESDPAAFAKLIEAMRTSIAEGPDASPAVLTSPDIRALFHAAPKLASAMGVDGLVLLRCPVSTAGIPGDCVVIYENLPGWGFAPAAQGLAADYRFAPGPVDMGIGGRKALVPIYFPSAPKLSSIPPATTSRPSARAVEILSEVLNLKSQDELAALAAPEIKRQLDILNQPGVDPAALNAFEAAFKDAAIRLLPEYTEDYLSIYAANFSEGELEQLHAFRGRSTGRKLLSEGGDLSAAVAAAAALSANQIPAIARAKFCAQHACYFEPPAPQDARGPTP